MGELLPQHPLGVRMDTAHMCPECGINVRPFCPVCLGAGTVTSARLARHQAEENRAIRVANTR